MKCDIRKFFANIDHAILLDILKTHIDDEDITWLLGEVVDSFSSTCEGVGLPLGNLTSQLLVNIYMNEFDRFVKQILKAKRYVRYSDDFVFLSDDREELEGYMPPIRTYLTERLRLELHPNKVYIKTLTSGVDFLGWIHFPDHRVLRTATKKRMLRRIAESSSEETCASYRGLLKCGNAHKLSAWIIENNYG